MNCLIIEDDISITKMLLQYLNLKGHQCTVSNDGRKGLELIKQRKFDVIILDLAMPEFSGYDIVDDLNNSGKMNDQNIVILSAAFISNTDSQKLISKGIKSYLRKPISPDILLKAISSI